MTQQSFSRRRLSISPPPRRDHDSSSPPSHSELGYNEGMGGTGGGSGVIERAFARRASLDNRFRRRRGSIGSHGSTGSVHTTDSLHDMELLQAMGGDRDRDSTSSVTTTAAAAAATAAAAAAIASEEQQQQHQQRSPVRNYSSSRTSRRGMTPNRSASGDGLFSSSAHLRSSTRLRSTSTSAHHHRSASGDGLYSGSAHLRSVMAEDFDDDIDDDLGYSISRGIGGSSRHGGGGGGSSGGGLDMSTGTAASFAGSSDHDAAANNHNDQNSGSSFSEYSEYDEDVFDPEWHARQNKLSQESLPGMQRQDTIGLSHGSMMSDSGTGMVSIGGSDTSRDDIRGNASQIFANRRDLREEVDQRVNLMDANIGNYDDPREYGELPAANDSNAKKNKRVPRSARNNRHKQQKQNNNNVKRQSSLVDIFLDDSAREQGEGVFATIRRTLSRDPVSSHHQQRRGSKKPGSFTKDHQRRRLFYHGNYCPSTSTTTRGSGRSFFENLCQLPSRITGGCYNCCDEVLERCYEGCCGGDTENMKCSCSMENCCKLMIILFCLVFVGILAMPQGIYWIQEQLGWIDEGTGEPVLVIPTPPSIPDLPNKLPTFPKIVTTPFNNNDKDDSSKEDGIRLEALREMILNHDLTSKTDLWNKESPQYLASIWLAKDDPANLTLSQAEDDGWGIVEPHKVLNRYAMAVFYIGMNGPRKEKEGGNKTDTILWDQTNWHTNHDWMSEKDVCEWYGIECEGDHIGHFNLTDNRLRGSIPSEMSIFTDLILVDWSHNEITGPVPEFIGSDWLDLEYLLLQKNSLEGTLPPNIGNLAHLRELILSHTNLKGSIPTEINQLAQLRVLKMDHNNLDGPIPPMGDLVASLEYLTFYSNRLTGMVHESLFQLTNLVELELDENSLKGSIPSKLSSFHNLEIFTISHNHFTGLLPDIFTQTPKLVLFQIHNNHIRGTIPPSLATLTNLEYLTLADNPLTGTIPGGLGNLQSLIVFQTHHTELVGSMPQEICSLEVRRGVDLIVYGDCEEGRFNCQCCSKCFSEHDERHLRRFS